MYRRFLVAVALTLPLLLADTAVGHSYKAGTVLVGHPWAEPADGPQGSAFVALLNPGKQADRLVSAHTPRAARVVIRDLVAGQPTPVAGIAVPPNSPVPMRPGARDLLLEGLKAPLRLGDKFPLTLVFEKAGPVEVEIFVETAPGH